MHLSLSSLYLDLLTRYEQAQELLEIKKVFLLKIIASASLPPPTPEQVPSSMEMVSIDGCAKREIDGQKFGSTRDLSQINALTMKPLRLLRRGVDGKISV